MSLLNTLIRRRRDAEEMRPLWDTVVREARNPIWYAQLGVEDSEAGRFDMLTAAFSLLLLRMERKPAMEEESSLVTELFVKDMDGQLRESGVGDLVVGKHVVKLMGTLGGRLGAYREGLADRSGSGLSDAVKRNVTLTEGADPSMLAMRLGQLYQRLCAADTKDVRKGEFW
ncbi:MAG TPA: ubiquinol-cytochrome C chaperone family protein [Alteraurantiacibacter sp.]|jgi:cytochrome b pre-mRNA-processing protein 3